MAVSPSKNQAQPQPSPRPNPSRPADANAMMKNLSKFNQFWVSSKGRTTTGFIAVCAATGYFAGHIGLHTWFLTRYRDAVQLYKNGFVTPLTADVFERAKSTLKDLRLEDRDKHAFRFFTVYGMDLFFAGSTKTISGSMIGIPRNFSYTKKEDVEKQDIVVENRNVEWGSDGGQLLQDSLILSENAQKFGIARNIAMSDTHHVYVHGGMGTLTIGLYYFLSHNANNMLYGLYKPRSFRTVVYAGLGTFCYGIWAVSRDLVTKLHENYADKRAGSININYAKGGVEFYSKTLQRNMALRSLMGPKGEKMFTLFGNDVEFIRERHVPFTRRKHNLEKIAERLSSSSDCSNSKRPATSAEPPILLKS